MSSLRRLASAMIAVVHLGPLAPHASAAAYDFVILATPEGTVRPLPGKAPSINQLGAVAFISVTANRPAGVRVATEPEGLYLIIDERGAADETIDEMGTFKGSFVAYRYNSVTAQTSTVARGNGGSPEPLYTAPQTNVIDWDAPAVNALGKLVLHQVADPNSILLVDDGVITTLFHVGQVLGNGTEIDGIFWSGPDIDDSGRVAFLASYDLPFPICDDRVLLSGQAVPIEIATGGFDTSCSFLTLQAPLALNSLGSAAYFGLFRISDEDPALFGLFVDGSIFWDERNPGFPPSAMVTDVALNDVGTVAFALEAPGAGRQVFIGNDPATDRVIGRGDSLCDATVIDIYFHRYGLNDANELALALTLSDGRHVIVRAEPSSGPGGECITTPVPEVDAGLGVLTAVAAIALLAGSRRAKPIVRVRDVA